LQHITAHRQPQATADVPAEVTHGLEKPSMGASDAAASASHSVAASELKQETRIDITPISFPNMIGGDTDIDSGAGEVTDIDRSKHMYGLLSLTDKCNSRGLAKIKLDETISELRDAIISVAKSGLEAGSAVGTNTGSLAIEKLVQNPMEGVLSVKEYSEVGNLLSFDLFIYFIIIIDGFFICICLL
jgi:hypothetical protein